MKVSAKVREEAALVCSAFACDRSLTSYILTGESLDVSRDAAWLAFDAAAVVTFERGGRDWGDADAEAEARLRTGWLPEGWK